MSNKNKDRIRELQNQLIRQETDLAALLAAKEELDDLLANQLELETLREAKTSLKAFFVSAWDIIDPGKPYMDNWHIDCLCDHLEAIQYGHIQNLILQVPPRTSKSSIASVVFPAWSWLINPTEKFITASAIEKLVLRDAVRSRRLIQSKWYQRFNPNFELQKDVNQKSRYENTAGGYRYATSVGSSAIGEGYSILVCLPFEEEIDTNLGSLKIGEIVENKINCKVKTFNHDTNKIEWLKIDRYEKNPRGNRTIYEVEIASGIKFQATEDHPIYNVGEGCYINVVDLKVGESVYVSMQSLPERNGKEKELLFQHLSNIGSQPFSSFRSGLQLLSNKIQKNEQGHKTFFNPFLQSHLFGEISKRSQDIPGKSFIYLSNLFFTRNGNTSQEKDRKVLLQEMCWNSQKVFIGKTLSKLWNIIQTKNDENNTVLQSMSSTISCKTNEWGGQQQLQAWPLDEYYKRQEYLPKRVQLKTEKENTGKVQQLLSTMQEKFKGFARTPYRFQQEQLFRGKFNSFVQILSRNFTWKKHRATEKCGNFTDTITRISRTENQPKYVYNIATGNHNYFCRGILIHNCDDPLKPSDINSKAAMANVIEWWTQTISTRKNSPDSRRILLHQRLAYEDPIGWELKNNDGLWENVCLPMEFEPERKFFTSIGWTDPRKEAGEILWPERFPPRELKNLKKVLGPYGTAAQLQQNPVPLEGGIIKKEWIVNNYYTNTDQFNRFSLNQFDLIVGSWDLTFSNTGDSWNVGIVVGKKGSDKYILDMWRGRYDIIQQRDAIREMSAKYPQIRAMLVEKKANGEAVHRVLKREIPGLILIDPRDIGSGDKEARLSACAIDFEANNVKFPHPSLPGYSWVELAIDELTLFPKTPNDDIVDAISMALNWLASKGNGRTTRPDILSNFQKLQDDIRKQENRVAPSKTELNEDGSKKIIATEFNGTSTFNTFGFKSYKNIFG